MTVIGFIPGLDVISDVYFLGKALVDVALGKGSWTDVAMAAVGFLLPVSIGAFKAIKTFAKAADKAGDAGRTLKNGANVADAGKAAGKADGIGTTPRPGAATDAGAGQSSARWNSQIDRKGFRKDRETYWKEEAGKSSGDYTPENLMRMEEGKPPIGTDGFPMELHHVDGTPTGGLRPMTRTDHRLGGNYERNHPWLK